jgi:NAD(P)H-hydrate epimerase
MAKAKACCLKYGINLVLKGANSLGTLADGRQVFNSSGTHYMATAGMGDALTGMLTSFLGQGYSPENALLCGVFHHGLAGELAGQRYLRGTMAQDLIEAIPETYHGIGLD